MKRKGYAGTYTSAGAQGIYSFVLEDGILRDAELFAKIENPKYVTRWADGIASVGDFPNGSGVALFDEAGNLLDAISYEDRTSCFITCDGDRLYTANYHAGTFSVLQIINNRLKLVDTILIRDGAGCHQVLVHDDTILVPCLFLDRVMMYDKMTLDPKGSIRFDQGTGPRHGVFTKDGKYLYLVSELSNELFVISCDRWKVLYRIPVLANGEMHVRDTAAIRMSDDEKYLYVSTRTKDVISVIALKDHVPVLKQVVSCGGKHPRDINLCDGYLISANRYSNELVSFPIQEDGTLGKETSRLHVLEAVSMLF